MATIDHPTIAASEDMDCLFVLVDRYAPDQAAAVAVLAERAREQWGHELRTDALPSAVKLWYKTVGDSLAPCTASDPEAESQWWVFSGVPADALQLAH
jgi:hypothetical protein